MAFELRPSWCLDDETFTGLIEMGPWRVDDGALLSDRHGDHWRPGQSVQVSRDVLLRVDPLILRQRLELWPGARVGIASRWSCRTTEEAGTHMEGPTPLPLTESVTLTMNLPDQIGGSVELETCVLVKWATDDRPEESCPDGAMIWSDGWSLPKSERSLLLEGSETRVPVRTVPFSSHFGAPSGALWAIDIDPSIGPEDLVANVVTVLLNGEVLDRDFPIAPGKGDASLIPASAASGIQVDLVRGLTAALVEELNGDEDWRQMDEGTVGAMIVQYLTETFGSVEAGLKNHIADEPTFSRELWHRFAPPSWGAK